MTVALGTSAPPFSLPGVDGATRSLDDYTEAPALALVWSCNHCPTSRESSYRSALVAQRRENLVRLREASDLLLGEDQPPVGEHVELRLCTLDGLRIKAFIS